MVVFPNPLIILEGRARLELEVQEWVDPRLIRVVRAAARIRRAVRDLDHLQRDPLPRRPHRAGEVVAVERLPPAEHDAALAGRVHDRERPAVGRAGLTADLLDQRIVETVYGGAADGREVASPRRSTVDRGVDLRRPTGAAEFVPDRGDAAKRQRRHGRDRDGTHRGERMPTPQPAVADPSPALDRQHRDRHLTSSARPSHGSLIRRPRSTTSVETASP